MLPDLVTVRMPWWIWLDASPSRSWSRRATIPGIWNKIWLNRGDLHDIPSVSISESEVPGAPEVLWGIQCCQLCCYVPYTSPVLFCVEQMCILNVIRLIDPDRPFTSAHYRDIQRSRSGCVLGQVLACPEWSRATLALTLRDVGPDWTFCAQHSLCIDGVDLAQFGPIWPNLAQGSPVSSESPWGRADKPVGTCWNLLELWTTIQ